MGWGPPEITTVYWKKLRPRTNGSYPLFGGRDRPHVSTAGTTVDEMLRTVMASHTPFYSNHVTICIPYQNYGWRKRLYRVLQLRLEIPVRVGNKYWFCFKRKCPIRTNIGNFGKIVPRQERVVLIEKLFTKIPIFVSKTSRKSKKKQDLSGNLDF